MCCAGPARYTVLPKRRIRVRVVTAWDDVGFFCARLRGGERSCLAPVGRGSSWQWRKRRRRVFFAGMLQIPTDVTLQGPAVDARRRNGCSTDDRRQNPAP